jgi:hypothetical protein
MNKITLSILALGLSFCVASSSSAADRAKGSSAFGSTPSGFATTSKRVALGFTTAGVLTIPGANTTALSGWFELSPSTSLQTTFGIAGTSPFQFGVGGYFRSRVSGNESAGFHVGGGLNLGSFSQGAVGTDFYVVISPLAGMHFNVPSISNIFLTLDGGVNFRIIGGNFDVAVQNTSPALGLSIHYIL